MRSRAPRARGESATISAPDLRTHLWATSGPNSRSRLTDHSRVSGFPPSLRRVAAASLLSRVVPPRAPCDTMELPNYTCSSYCAAANRTCGHGRILPCGCASRHWRSWKQRAKKQFLRFWGIRCLPFYAVFWIGMGAPPEWMLRTVHVAFSWLGDDGKTPQDVVCLNAILRHACDIASLHFASTGHAPRHTAPANVSSSSSVQPCPSSWGTGKTGATRWRTSAAAPTRSRRPSHRCTASQRGKPGGLEQGSGRLHRCDVSAAAKATACCALISCSTLGLCTGDPAGGSAAAVCCVPALNHQTQARAASLHVSGHSVGRKHRACAVAFAVTAV